MTDKTLDCTEVLLYLQDRKTFALNDVDAMLKDEPAQKRALGDQVFDTKLLQYKERVAVLEELITGVANLARPKNAPSPELREALAEMRAAFVREGQEARAAWNVCEDEFERARYQGVYRTAQKVVDWIDVATDRKPPPEHELETTEQQPEPEHPEPEHQKADTTYVAWVTLGLQVAIDYVIQPSDTFEATRRTLVERAKHIINNAIASDSARRRLKFVNVDEIRIVAINK